MIDPHLPTWLPWVELSGLRVGGAEISLRFFRTSKGASRFLVTRRRGKLHILRQPPPDAGGPPGARLGAALRGAPVLRSLGRAVMVPQGPI